MLKVKTVEKKGSYAASCHAPACHAPACHAPACHAPACHAPACHGPAYVSGFYEPYTRGIGRFDPPSYCLTDRLIMIKFYVHESSIRKTSTSNPGFRARPGNRRL